MAYSCSINLDKALDWQRSNAPILTALIEKKQLWYDENHCSFWNDWAVDVFNLDTASEFGLSVWSQILSLQLFDTSDVSPSDYPNWGFTDYGMNFYNGNFASDGNRDLNLSTEEKRLVLKIRAFNLFKNPTIPDINNLMDTLFGKEDDEITPKAYVIDNLDMTMTYYLSLTINQGLRAAIENLGILPRPAAVAINIVNVEP